MTRHHSTVSICLISIVTSLLNNYWDSLFFKYFIDIIFHHIFCYTINNLLKLQKKNVGTIVVISIQFFVRITLQRYYRSLCSSTRITQITVCTSSESRAVRKNWRARRNEEWRRHRQSAHSRTGRRPVRDRTGRPRRVRSRTARRPVLGRTARRPVRDRTGRPRRVRDRKGRRPVLERTARLRRVRNRMGRRPGDTAPARRWCSARPLCARTSTAFRRSCGRRTPVPGNRASGTRLSTCWPRRHRTGCCSAAGRRPRPPVSAASTPASKPTVRPSARPPPRTMLPTRQRCRTTAQRSTPKWKTQTQTFVF